jgi:hypothetical protein
MTEDRIYVGIMVASLAALVLYIPLVVIPSWWTAHQECSGTNGVVVEQKDILRPVVCLRVQP